MAERGGDSLESLKQQLRDIYNPLIGCTFKAWYKGRVRIECTGYERDVFKLYNVGESQETSVVIMQILKVLKHTRFEGKALYPEGDRNKEIVWKGITTEGEYYKLWVVPLDREPIKERKYEQVVKSIDFFDETCDEFKWIKDHYKVGVNIHLS